jgi:Na+/melibiose symporter-like transporter
MRGEERGARAAGSLGVGRKLLLGSGDHALTLTLSSLSLVYVVFLNEQVGLRPAVAVLIPWIGRFVDAFTDPLMGRITDLTRSRWGRRRPYFLLGAGPFALSFALLWVDPELDSDLATFGFCLAAYVFYSLASTLVSVPYVAVVAEVVPGFEQRNSVNAYRSALTLAGTLLAASGFKPLADALGAAAGPDYLAAGSLLGIWVGLPFLLLSVFVREPVGFQRAPRRRLVEGLRLLAAHRNYSHLAGLYVCGRIAMDLAGMILLFYFTYWLGRPGDFAPTMALFILSAALALPLWTRLAARTQKKLVFQLGCAWWGGFMLLLFFIEPGFPPRWATFAIVGIAALGYGVIDMIPWSMLADVADEDELISGDRREGLYGGVLTWARKLGGATGVLLGGLLLDASGFDGQAATQSEGALGMVRGIAAFGPALFLGLAIWASRGYALTRQRHAEIVSQLGGRAA